MRRCLLLAAILCLLLCGCAKSGTVQSAAEQAEPSLVGVWVNRGQYGPGQDFVETMTLTQDGEARVHLDYQGAPYADLEGQWSARDGLLLVTFRDPEVQDRSYAYTLSDATLTLTGAGKDVTYQRQTP